MADGIASNYRNKRQRPRWATLIIVALLHVIALFGLAAAFAPKWTGEVMEEVGSLVTVQITAPPEPEVVPEPEPEPKPDEGAAAPEGPKAKPKETVAPDPPIKTNPKPVPKAKSDGDESRSGAAERGSGTGAGGEGDGTGSGRSGDGQGGVPLRPVTKPSVRSGELNDARDYPRPEGGRKARFGKSVTVVFTVGTDGRARNCSVARSSVDAESTALTCGLVMDRIRFNPATDQNGDPIEARYGYRVDFRAR